MIFLVARLLLFRLNTCLSESDPLPYVELAQLNYPVLTPTFTHPSAHIIAQSRAVLVVREVKASSGKTK